MEFDHTELINRRFKELGLALTFGGHVDERDDFMSSAISSRVDDLHAAFADPEVDGILTVIGGFNSNELLPNLDWDLIAANPKVFCGFSDITALQNAILARTGLVTFSGPHWSTFGMRDHFELTMEWFVRALFDDGPWECQPARFWTDDAWFLNQDDRTVRENDGWWPIRAGRAEGRLVGGNLCTLNLLQGTANMPPLAGALLMVEDDDATDPATFARDLTSLLQLPDAGALAGLVVGRFQRASAVTRDLLEQILARQPALVGRPVLANADFGHTSPMMTWPVGGRGTLAVGPESRFTIGGD
jgi:muramoyltetrapeptide carboxypeptidase LdcA involved in peptidoglycan recycling